MKGNLKPDKFDMAASLKAGLDNSWALALMVISLLSFVANTWQPASNQITHGFAAYYTASRLTLDRRGGELFYDDSVFQREVESLTDSRASDIYWANPPTTALLFLPLAGLSISNARYVWMVLSLFALLLAMWLSGLVILRLPLRTNTFHIVSAILFLSEPVAENFRFGQAYVVIFALYTLALFALSSGLDWLAGLWLGLALVLKASGIPLLVLLLLRGKWRIICGALLTFFVMVLFSLPLTGLAAWRNYVFDVIPKFLADPVLASTAYQTVPGFIQHMFTYHDIWNPNPLVNLPVVATMAKPFAGLLLLGIAARYSHRATVEWTFCVGLILSVILIPAAEQYHYVLLCPAFLLAAHSPRVPKLALFISAGLTALPLDFMTQDLAMGWWALLAYPRLYGAIILFIILQFHREDSKLSSSGEATKPDAVAGVQ